MASRVVDVHAAGVPEVVNVGCNPPTMASIQSEMEVRKCEDGENVQLPEAMGRTLRDSLRVKFGAFASPV